MRDRAQRRTWLCSSRRLRQIRSVSFLALGDFFGGAAPSYVTVDALLDPELIIQLGVAPVRVDVLSHFATLSFSEAWRTRVG
jgi:hypothetical protein